MRFIFKRLSTTIAMAPKYVINCHSPGDKALREKVVIDRAIAAILLFGLKTCFIIT
jgi:hypothetical protein